MRYYLFQGTVMSIEERFWSHLLKNEPTVKEVKDYEKNLGVIPTGGASKVTGDVGRGGVEALAEAGGLGDLVSTKMKADTEKLKTNIAKEVRESHLVELGEKAKRGE